MRKHFFLYMSMLCMMLSSCTQEVLIEDRNGLAYPVATDSSQYVHLFFVCGAEITQNIDSFWLLMQCAEWSHDLIFRKIPFYGYIYGSVGTWITESAARPANSVTNLVRHDDYSYTVPLATNGGVEYHSCPIHTYLQLQRRFYGSAYTKNYRDSVVMRYEIAPTQPDSPFWTDNYVQEADSLLLQRLEGSYKYEHYKSVVGAEHILTYLFRLSDSYLATLEPLPADAYILTRDYTYY